MERMWVRVRAAICLLAISLALVGMPASALAARGHHPAPDPRPLWRVYPLGTQRLATSPGTGPAATGIKQHSDPIARSASGYALPIGLPEMLAVAALLSVLAAMAPIAVRRRGSRPPRVAQVMAREELTEPLRSARRELIDARPVPPTARPPRGTRRSSGTRPPMRPRHSGANERRWQR